jgi:hypothetical protein
MRITWDAPEDRPYSEGVSQGVMFPDDSPGVAWNGLISVARSPGQTLEPRYFDGQKYHDRNITGPFAGTISAYTYPDELEPYIGVSGAYTGQRRRSFGFCFRTNRELHLVYNVLLAPSDSEYRTVGDSPDPVTFAWDFTTVPEKIPGGKPSSHLVIMTDDAQPGAISDLEALIYGDDVNDPFMPLPAEVRSIFESYMPFSVTDNFDGTWTATGSGAAISMIDDTTFRINWPTVVLIDEVTFTISSE